MLIPGNKSKTVKAIPEAPSFSTPSQSHHFSTISLDNAPVSDPVAFPTKSNILAEPSSPAFNSFPTDAAQKENPAINNLFEIHENHCCVTTVQIEARFVNCIELCAARGN